MKKRQWWKGSWEVGGIAQGVAGVVEPRQARSLKSFQAILEGAVSLLYERGLEGVTVQDVMKESGVGASSFYGKFEGRDALLEYLAVLFWSDSKKEWAMILEEKRWVSCHMDLRIELVMGMLVRWFGVEGPILNALLIHALADEGVARLGRISNFDNWMADAMTTLLIARKEEISHPAPDLAVRIGTLQAIATLRSRLLFLGRGQKDGISDDDLAIEMSKGFAGHLQSSDGNT